MPIPIFHSYQYRNCSSIYVSVRDKNEKPFPSTRPQFMLFTVMPQAILLIHVVCEKKKKTYSRSPLSFPFFIQPRLQNNAMNKRTGYLKSSFTNSLPLFKALIIGYQPSFHLYFLICKMSVLFAWIHLIS